VIRTARWTLGILAACAAGFTVQGWTIPAQAGTPDTWTAVAPLPHGRLWPAVASAAGKLYVFTGLGPECPNFCSTFEAYDPATNTWTAKGKMPEGLNGLPSATTGPDGRIYLVGGVAQSDLKPTGGADMLVYDPGANTWGHAPPPPGVGTGTVLVTGRDGRIYAVGGGLNNSKVSPLLAYDVHTLTWTALAPDRVGRFQPAVSVGPDGRIYVIGGDKTLAGVEAYDPRKNAWVSIPALPNPRTSLEAVTGPDGRIYALGGEGNCAAAPCHEVEAYDVRTDTWTAVAPMPHGRFTFSAVAGPDGRMYVLGGFTSPAQGPPPSLPTSVDAYTVVPGDQPLPPPPPGPIIATRVLAPMPTARYGLGAATSGGKIYAIGGQMNRRPKPGKAGPPPAPRVLRKVEVYDPATNTWTAAPSLPSPRADMGVTTGPDGRIYVLGGIATLRMPNPNSNEIDGLHSVEIYDPGTRRWSTGKPMPDGRFGLAAVTGRDGRIYTIGGGTMCFGDALTAARIMPQLRPARHPLQTPSGDCNGEQSVRAFNPRTNTWTTLAPLPAGRLYPTAAVGADGRIYVFGGESPPSKSFAVYDPAKNLWTSAAGLPRIRVSGLVAAAGGDGRIDLIGGCLVEHLTRTGFYGYCGSPSVVDAYDPRTNKWTKIGVTFNARQALAATTGPDGRVYAVGGQGAGNGKLLEEIP